MQTHIWKKRLLASMAFASAISLSACVWDQSEKQSDAIDALWEHYVENPPPPRWTLSDVRISGKDKMEVDILVEDEIDVRKIQARSHMTKFFIAKLGCPKGMSGAHLQEINGYRIWVRLLSESQPLTQSICPDRSV